MSTTLWSVHASCWYYHNLWFITRVGTNFWLKIGNFFLVKLFKIVKKPFDGKRSSDSKYSSLMSVARREVNEFKVFMRQKSFKIDLLKSFEKFQNFFWLFRGKPTRQIRLWKNHLTARNGTVRNRRFSDSFGTFWCMIRQLRD